MKKYLIKYFSYCGEKVIQTYNSYDKAYKEASKRSKDYKGCEVEIWKLENIIKEV